MAFRGAISLGKQLNTNSLCSVSSYLRTSYSAVSVSNTPFTRSTKDIQQPTGVKLGYQIRAISGTATDPVAQKKTGNEDPLSTENWKIKMLYDGDCPLCMKEVDMLRERNKTYGTIKFVDISSGDYSPEENQGLDYETAMGRIHAIQSDGTVVRDIEVFRNFMGQLAWDGCMLSPNMNLLQPLLMPFMVFGLNIVFKLQAGHLLKRFWRHAGRRKKCVKAGFAKCRCIPIISQEIVSDVTNLRLSRSSTDLTAIYVFSPEIAEMELFFFTGPAQSMRGQPARSGPPYFEGPNFKFEVIYKSVSM